MTRRILQWMTLLVLCLALGGCGGRSPDGVLLGEEAESEEPASVPEDEEPEDGSDPGAGTAGTGSGPGTEAGSDGAAAETSSEISVYYVYVCGYVAEPGVYTLSPSSRVMDAVAAAGGFADGADTEYWNLAEFIADGEQIRIPSEDESREMEPRSSSAGAGTSGTGSGAEGSSGAAAGTAASGLVNLNTATREELMTLTGIGEVKADAILAYREAHGNFSSIEEIMNVSGIKEAAFEKIKDKITV